MNETWLYHYDSETKQIVCKFAPYITENILHLRHKLHHLLTKNETTDINCKNRIKTVTLRLADHCSTVTHTLTLHYLKITLTILTERYRGLHNLYRRTQTHHIK